MVRSLPRLRRRVRSRRLLAVVVALRPVDLRLLLGKMTLSITLTLCPRIGRCHLS